MHAERALLAVKEQRRKGAASHRSWADRVVKEGEKGLQDKGSASLALLSLCLHILFLRDTVSLGGDRSMRNSSYPPLSRSNHEQRPRSPAYLTAVAVGPLVSMFLP
jgi:hypothetical protein